MKFGNRFLKQFFEELSIDQEYETMVITIIG